MDEIKHDWLMQVERAVYQGDMNPSGEQQLSDEISNTIRSIPGPLTAAKCVFLNIFMHCKFYGAAHFNYFSSVMKFIFRRKTSNFLIYYYYYFSFQLLLL